MGFLKKFIGLRKNKTFGYQPRFYDDKGEGNPFKIEYKFDQYRSTVGSNKGLKTKLRKVMEDTKREGDRNIKKRMAVIIAILIFIFLYIIDFDLSIFFS